MKLAILVDGGFYRKRAARWKNDDKTKKSGEERALELEQYCLMLLKKSQDEVKDEHVELYRVFYYDSPCTVGFIPHPHLKMNIDLSKTSVFKWTESFLNKLKTLRKFAIRLGKLTPASKYEIKSKVMDDIIRGKRKIEDITQHDYTLKIQQKGVDMRIGLDISSLAYKHLVDQIILVSGDSDFVPAAKLARREGIDFILDPMQSGIADDLQEHVDGVITIDKPTFKNLH